MKEKGFIIVKPGKKVGHFGVGIPAWKEGFPFVQGQQGEGTI